MVDLAMRRWLHQYEPEPGWMLEHVDALLDEAEQEAKDTGDGVVKWKHANDKTEVREFCRELVVRLERHLAVLCLPFEWEEAVRFAVPVTIPGLDGAPREIILNGEVDLLVRDRSRGEHIWDLKGTKDNAYYRKVTGQLVFYEIARAAKTGKWPVESGLIQPMCTEPVITFDFAADGSAARRQMMTTIVGVAHDIWSNQMPPKESNDGCQWCPVRHACPKFAVPGGRGRATLLGGAAA